MPTESVAIRISKMGELTPRRLVYLTSVEAIGSDYPELDTDFLRSLGFASDIISLQDNANDGCRALAHRGLPNHRRRLNMIEGISHPHDGADIIRAESNRHCSVANGLGGVGVEAGLRTR